MDEAVEGSVQKRSCERRDKTRLVSRAIAGRSADRATRRLNPGAQPGRALHQPLVTAHQGDRVQLTPAQRLPQQCRRNLRQVASGPPPDLRHAPNRFNVGRVPSA